MQITIVKYYMPLEVIEDFIAKTKWNYQFQKERIVSDLKWIDAPEAEAGRTVIQILMDSSRGSE